MPGWWLMGLLLLSPPPEASAPVSDEAPSVSAPQQTASFATRAIRMQYATTPWWHDASPEGRLALSRDGAPLTRREALEAAGEDKLARRQQAAELAWMAGPFVLCFPLMVPPMVGFALGGLAPSVVGAPLEDILNQMWVGLAIGATVGALLAVALATGGLLLVQWLRVDDDEIASVLVPFNRAVAVGTEAERSEAPPGFFSIAPVGAE